MVSDAYAKWAKFLKFLQQPTFYKIFTAIITEANSIPIIVAKDRIIDFLHSYVALNVDAYKMRLG